ncbi:MAG: hypothetical protein NTU83_12190 [Candidatus Hydrogenedentes bacterium]|nr:hypothetical protein [Candidatus Hydrogenedentota bacterium]
MRRFLAVALCISLAACATGHKAPDVRRNAPDTGRKAPNAGRVGHEKPKAGKVVPKETAKEPVASKDPAPPVTITQQMDTLGDTVVHFGEEVGGSLVVMKGVENRPVPPMNYQKTAFKKVATEIAGATQCNVATYPSYTFLYPPGYENLLGLSLANRLDPAMASRTVAMTFGSDTPLHKAFTLLSASLNATVLADNVLAEARTGAVTLAEIPVGDALEAILKSARVVPDAFQVESTPEYVFFYAGPPVPAHTTLINADALKPEDSAYLDTVVDLYLPSKPDDTKNYEIPSRALPLGSVLDALSQQLGRVVVAAPGMEEFPVNPCALIKVRVRTAMDLLIRQWPVPDFGYTMEGGRIVIRRNKS